MRQSINQRYIVQCLTSFQLNILALGTGASYGIVNVLLSKLEFSKERSVMNSSEISINQSWSKTNNNSLSFQFMINSDEASWIASFGMIGQYFPIFFVGPLVGKYGKRVSMMIDCILFLIGFLLICFSMNVFMIYIAKFFMGYAYLTSRSSIQPFICEISDPSIRGATSTLWALCFTSGQALSITTANIIGWRYVSGFFAALMAICFILLTQIHETPDWLLEKCYFGKAVKALEFYKIDPKIIVYESEKRELENGNDKSYRQLVEFYRQESKAPNCSRSKKTNKISSFSQNIDSKRKWAMDTMKRPEVYKPFLFLAILLGLLELSGFAVLANYSIILVKRYGYGAKTFVGPETLITIISLLRIPFGFLAMPVLQKYKRRIIYLTICIFLFFVIIGIIIFTHLTEKGLIDVATFQNSIGLQIVPFLLFTLFYAGFSFGYGNIPFALMGELFPPSVSNFANTAIFVTVNSIELTAVKTALLIRDEHGLQYLFVIPAVAILLSAIFSGLFMPETQGMTLQEIAKIYSPDKVETSDEDMPYFHVLRSKDSMEHMKRIHQIATMLISSPDAIGMVKMEGERKKTYQRSKTVNHIRRKASVKPRNMSLPIVLESMSELTSNGMKSIDEDICYDIYPFSIKKDFSKEKDDFFCSKL